MRKKVVIFGDDHHNALGLLRMLGNSDFDVLLLINGPLKKIATASKYCKQSVQVKNVQEGLNYLYENYTDMENKAVLLFTADKYSEAANNNLDRLKDYFYVSGPSIQGLLASIDDKYAMSMLASECEITIPETYLYPGIDLSTISFFPIVFKPCSPVKKQFKIEIAHTRKELRSIQESLYKEKRYVVQQFIEKEADGLVYGCRTNDGRTILSGICIRNRWGDDDCGSFGYITSEIPKSINQGGIAKFLEKIDFKGLFSVEYALTKDNKAFFYEFNLRNDGTSVLFYNAGTNLALTYVNSCFGIEDDVPSHVCGKHYLMHEILDKFNIYDGKVSRKQWNEEKKKVTLHFLYDPDDMKPYELQKSQETKLFIHHIISRSWINRIRLKIRNHLK